MIANATDIEGHLFWWCEQHRSHPLRYTRYWGSSILAHQAFFAHECALLFEATNGQLDREHTSDIAFR
jgi:hypothetical protein